MKIRTKIVALLATFAVIFGAGCNCGGGGGKGGQTTVTVWTVAPLIADYGNRLSISGNTDKQALFTKWVVDTFEEQNPDIKIKLVDQGAGDVLHQQVQMAIAGGGMPDVLATEQYLPLYMNNGHLSEVDLGEIANDLIPAAKKTATKDGKLYAAPMYTGSFGLSVNKAILIDAGVLDANGEPAAKYKEKNIDPVAPKTMENLLEICQDIKKHYSDAGVTNKGGTVISLSNEGSAWRALAFMRLAGGEFADENGNITVGVGSNGKANEKAFLMMRELSKTAPLNAVMANNDLAVLEYFLKGQVAYLLDGMDSITRIPNYNGVDPANVVVSELPVFEGVNKKSNVQVGSTYFAIPRTAKNPEAANTFLRFLLSEEVQLKIAEADLRVPCRLSVLNGDEIKNVEGYDYFKGYIIPYKDTAYSFSGALPVFENNNAQIWEKWRTFIRRVVTGNTPIEGSDGILATLQTEMRALQQAK